MRDRTGLSEVVVMVAAVLLGIGVLFGPGLLRGEVIVPGDIPYNNPFWHSLPADEYRPAQNPLLSDKIVQNYVYHRLASEVMQAEGGIPLWNPYILTGQPLAGNIQSALFYPPNLLLFWLTPGQATTIRQVVDLLIMGVFAYLYCRQVGVSRYGSLLAGLAAAFCGPMTAWLGYGITGAAAPLPLLLWSGEKLIAQDRPLRWSIPLAVGVALSVFGGHPETTFQVMAPFYLYMAGRLLSLAGHPAECAKRAGLLAAGIMLGFAVSAVQLLPFADALLDSATLAHGGRSMGGENALYWDQWPADAAALGTAVYPNLFGNPVDRNYWWPFQTYQNYNEQTFYFGLIPLALAIGGLLSRRKPRWVLVLGLVALLCVGVAIRLPGVELVNHLPVFSLALNKRLRIQASILGALAAGHGFDVLIRPADRRQGLTDRFGYTPVIALASVPPLAIAILAVFKPAVPAIRPGSFSYHLLQKVFIRQQPETWVPVSVLLIATGLYLILRRARTGRALMGATLVGLTALELMVVAYDYNPTMPESDILPETPALDAMAELSDPIRILTTDRVFWPNYPAAFRIGDVAGYDYPIDQRYSSLFRGQGGTVDYRQEWQPDWSLVNLLNVRFVLTTQELAAPHLVLHYEDEYFRIYENRQALPRAFVVQQVSVAESPTETLEAMLSGDWEFQRVALLDEPLTDAEMNSLGREGAHSVAFVEYGLDEVTLEVDTEVPGLLVMSDLYTPDWRATVDGKAVELHRANYAYRGVYLPAGRHQLRFSYEPMAYRVGLAITMVGLAALGVICVVPWLSSVRSERGDAHD